MRGGPFWVECDALCSRGLGLELEKLGSCCKRMPRSEQHTFVSILGEEEEEAMFIESTRGGVRG